MRMTFEWRSEVAGRRVLQNPRLLVTDAPGMAAPDVRAIQGDARDGRPLVLVTPGVDASALYLVKVGEIAAIKATALPDQPLDSLLQDLAVAAGTPLFARHLGFGLPPVELAGSRQVNNQLVSAGGLILPNSPWAGCLSDSPGDCTAVEVDDDVCTFDISSRDLRSRLDAHAAQIARIAGPDELDGVSARRQRLGAPALQNRFGGAASRFGAAPREAGGLTVHAGMASAFFVTDPDRFEAVLDRALVLVSNVAVDKLSLVTSALEHAMRTPAPLVVLAPGFSAAVVATMVVNKLRGLAASVAAVLTDRASASEIAALTGATPLNLADDRASTDPWRELGRSRRIQVGRFETVVSPPA